MVEYADIYVTTKNEKMKGIIEKTFSKLKCNQLTVVVIENRGRDVSALLVPFKGVMLDYEYICFVHDKKTTQLKPYSVGESFSYKCFDNLLGGKDLVENIITTFDNNPKLGMLSPPPPNHGMFYQTLAGEWANNYANTASLAYRLGISVPITPGKEPISPLGTMFWFRPKAMKRLIEYDWEYSDFPKEPNATDGTLLHAIERVYGLVVQAEGYLSGWVMSDKCASMEVTNLNFMTRELNKALYPKYGLSRFFVLIENIKISNVKGNKMPLHLRVRRISKKIFPRPIFILLVKFKRLIFGPRGMKGNFD
jgi:rhamnosyltransferase